MTNSNIPPPLKLLRQSQLSRNYILNVVQNPTIARCCGFGDKDRRLIDPPPIIELIAKDEYGNIINLKPEDTVLFLVQCELYNKDMTENRTLVHTPWSIQADDNSSKRMKRSIVNDKPDIIRNLIGSNVSNAYHLYNQEKSPGIYFIFNDLSIRIEGIFTLKFVFIDLAAGEPLTMSTFVQKEVYSAPFYVYPAKKFPGLTGSTSLSKCFVNQGIKIPIRSDTSRRKHALNEASEEELVEKLDQEQDNLKNNVNTYGGDSNQSNPVKRLSIKDFLSPN